MANFCSQCSNPLAPTNAGVTAPSAPPQNITNQAALEGSAAAAILDGCIALIVLVLLLIEWLSGAGFVQAAVSSGAVGVGMWVYFIPSRIAFKRSKKQKTPIAVLNLLLGWTILGWVGALVWATSSE